MIETNRTLSEEVVPGLQNNLQRVDEDLEIMERHASEMTEVEEVIQDAMRKWDREYKDSCLHSTPRPRKHMR